MAKIVEIAGRKIGKNFPPYIVAELSANHGGRLENALASIERAAMCGADAIKLQTYTADSMTLNIDAPDFVIDSGLWQGHSLYELYERAHTPLDWHKPLFDKANELGITIFSSPFDETAVDFLEQLDTPAYKIASFELVDLPLIRHVAKKNKPIIMSTGMANLAEIESALDTATRHGAEEIILLHCVSGYPTPVSECNLRTLMDLAERFDVVVGLSDHSKSNVAAVTSVALGACFVEKHFILDANIDSPDASFSITPDDLKDLVNSTHDAWRAIGQVNYTRTKSEVDNVKFRRSIYFVRPLAEGQRITRSDIRRVRPGFGLAPKYYDQLLGMTVTKSVGPGDPVTWDVLAK